ncbi:MAG TPA: DUF4173 domain-containing protein [Acidimicrobiales bacterium]|nr:DUF4173 domain-containing protein [Acidimicrobiales bacterium]
MTATLADEPDALLVAEPPDTRVVVAAAVGAVGLDIALRSGVASLGGAVCVVAVSAALAWSGRIRNPHAVAALMMAPVFGVFLALRQSPWLVLLDLAVVALCLAVAASFAKGGSLLDVGALDLAVRAGRALLHGMAGGPFVAAAVPRSDGRHAAVVRGLLLALPLVFVVGALLASADAVFASFFETSFDPSSLITHVVLWAVGAWSVGGLLRLASASSGSMPVARVPRLGQVETCVVLGALVALYASFAVAQVVAASEGGRRVLRVAGLTSAEYARSGFFQLLVVAALTLVILLLLDNGSRPVRLLSLAAVGLTLVIVASAVRRLFVYEEAFGLTMLRLFSTVFAVWVGAVFVLLGARLLGVAAGRRWLLGAATAVGLALLLVLNVVDAEAVVARRNVARTDFDPGHAAQLSDDAVPALVEGGRRDVVCPRPYQIGEADGWAAWNLNRERARSACGQP